MVNRIAIFWLLAALSNCILENSLPAWAQQTYPDRDGADRKGDDGFRPIFNGKTLDGWEGDPVYWRVVDACIVGEVTPATILKRNSFLIWRGGEVADFELKLEFRISPDGNSGVNYRSREVDGTPHALRGYQADIDGANRYTGQNYEERGRTFLALRGDVARVDADGVARIIGSVGAKEALADGLTAERFHQMHLIARGDTLIHLIDGRAMSVVVDDQPIVRSRTGLVGVQVHVGPPMKVEFRGVRLKQLDAGGDVGAPK